MAKAAKKSTVNSSQIQEAYIDYVLMNNEPPKSIYLFAKSLKISEAEFYNFYTSFMAIEKTIWAELTETTITKIAHQEIWSQYTSREKILSFFFSFVELLKTQRSFVLYSLKKAGIGLSTPEVLLTAKQKFESFADTVIKMGLESGELAHRKFLSERYKNGLSLQFAFILHFWAEDESKDFEKTDEAIEKGINLSFDFFQHSPIDNLFEYGKFIVRNGKLREKMGI
ncbi:MAG TPA: TetR family transcriptional regulator C-terminal domain-containing protein [Arachidicoccus soli]|nr:TetR family transcriptional regulator C-terminal domain-containing protein [Arachidicoccus soli]